MMRLMPAALALLCSVGIAHAQNLSSDDLARRTIERRAVDAAIWGMPAVNYDLMLQEMLNKTDGKVGQVIYWGRPLDAKNQTLTPNPDALYLMTFFNTKNGPVVLDLPPGRWCSTCRPATPTARSTATSSPSGRCRWRMSACLERTRARAESSSCCRPASR